VKVAINAPSEEMANANIEAKLDELTNVYSSYNTIARYYLSVGNNADALKYSKMSVESAEKFWNVKVLSEAYAANGDYKKAVETAEKSLKLSQEAEYDPYIKMNTENIAKWKAMK
jgi:tetratricopeptide (TPR) repeat protein